MTITQRGLFDMARAHRAQEDRSPGWTEDAATELRRFALHRADFTIDEARAHVESIVGAPEELRAWGSVTRYAARRGWIVPTGTYRSSASSNGSPKPVYRGGAR